MFQKKERVIFIQSLEINKNDLLEYLSNNEFEELEDIEDTGLNKARNFFILLYPDSSSYNYKEVIRILTGYKKWAYIEHDPEDDEKKKHTHFFIQFDNPRSLTGLSKETGIPERFLKVPRSVRSVNRYLVHIDDKDKIQYPLCAVNVSKMWERNFSKCFDDLETEEEIIIKIYNFIDSLVLSQPTYVQCIKTLMLWTYKMCYDTIYRKYRNEFDNYLRNMI